jgi:FKBP-type peptidyl-prolyl cis-trans isomerase
VKTRLEIARESVNAEDVSGQPPVELSGGVTCQELRIGGGTTPHNGDLVVLNYKCALYCLIIDVCLARQTRCGVHE